MTENYPTKQVCVDVSFDDVDDRKKLGQIISKVALRSVQKGEITKPFGGEIILLKKAAGKKINGEILGVDGLTETGVNLSANVSEDEVKRMREDPSYQIHAELDITKPNLA